MDLDLAEIWPLERPWRLGEDTLGGANNQLRRVEAGGASYMLRIHGNHADPTLIRYELEVLDQLQRHGLSFAVPAPIPTRSGDLWFLDTAVASPRLLTLTPLISGQHPPIDNLSQAAAAGAALAELDEALAAIVPPDAPALPPYADPARIHPLVPDPLAAIAELDLAPESKQRLIRLVGDLCERAPEVYRDLPWQITHGDYTRHNLLLAGTRVCGVLDFEFCTADARIADLAVALGSWAWPLIERGTEWAGLETFGRAYGARIALAPAEQAALPTLMLLRGVCVLIHSIGRQRQGLGLLAPLATVAGGVFKVDDWLRSNGARLVERAGGWGAG